MTWRDVHSVLADPMDRARAIRHTVPIILMTAVGLYLMQRLEPRIEFPRWENPLLLVAVLLPMRLYFVAGWIRRPLTRRETFRRMTIVWTILIGSFLILYFVVLR
jgi:hypothetical protein